MIRPFTCVCLVLAAGSGLYLYQVKQRAFALDAALRSTFHQIDEAREHTRMLRADWALMNDPERLQALAGQYLTLQPMAPNQLMTIDQLAAALPPPIPPGAKPAAAPAPTPAVDPAQGMPMAMVAPKPLPPIRPAVPQVALLQPAAPALAAPASAAPALAAPAPAAPAPTAAAVASPTAAPAIPVAPVAVVPPPSFAQSAPAPTFALQAPPPSLAMAMPAPPKPAAVPPPKPVHRWMRHVPPAPEPWLASANAAQSEKLRRAHRHAPPPPPVQFYAANEPARQPPDVPPRITPPAATVMYSPVSGSSLGMAASATLAPPRPLYSTAQ